MESAEKIHEHLLEFRLSLPSLGDPPPDSAIQLFNSFLDEAKTRRTFGVAIDEIPYQRPGVRLSELMLWAGQLQTTLRR